MPSYDDDDEYDPHYDDQDEAGEYDDDADGDGDIADAEYCDEIRALLAQKFGINLPDHVTPDTFLRDMLMALHGHPGQEAAAKLSHRRRRKRKQLSQGRRQPARTAPATRDGVTPARAAEQLKNSRL